MSKPRWFPVLTEEVLGQYCQKHSCDLSKNIFRFKSCDFVCLEGINPFHIQSHVKVLTMFDIDSISLDQISHLFDCFYIQKYGKSIALRPWRDCVRTTEGCTKHVYGDKTKFCSFTCKIEHVLEHEGDLSSITRNWSEDDDSRETSELVGDLSIHPCGDPDRNFPLKKRSRRRRLYDSDDDLYGY